MKIKHYLYNAFVIESGDKKLAIDMVAPEYGKHTLKEHFEGLI